MVSRGLLALFTFGIVATSLRNTFELFSAQHQYEARLEASLFQKTKHEKSRFKLGLVTIMYVPNNAKLNSSESRNHFVKVQLYHVLTLWQTMEVSFRAKDVEFILIHNQLVNFKPEESNFLQSLNIKVLQVKQGNELLTVLNMVEYDEVFYCRLGFLPNASTTDKVIEFLREENQKDIPAVLFDEMSQMRNKYKIKALKSNPDAMKELESQKAFLLCDDNLEDNNCEIISNDTSRQHFKPFSMLAITPKTTSRMLTTINKKDRIVKLQDRCSIRTARGLIDSIPNLRMIELKNAVKNSFLINLTINEMHLKTGYASKLLALHDGDVAPLHLPSEDTFNLNDCSADVRVAAFAKVAERFISHIEEPESKQKYKEPELELKHRYAIGYRTHIFNERVKKTINSWARQTKMAGGEFFTVVVNGLSSNCTNHHIQEARQGGFKSIHVHEDVYRLVPYEAPQKYREAQEKSPLNSRSYYKYRGWVSRVPAFRLVKFKWIWVYFIWAPVFVNILKSNPAAEYYWLIDYDVTFTGSINTLINATDNDDSDFLAVSLVNSDTTDLETLLGLEKADRMKENWHWWPMTREWSGEKSRRSSAAIMRLSRRMVMWCLEAMFTPTNLSLDEAFFASVCAQNKGCTYRPLNSFTIDSMPIVTRQTYSFRKRKKYLETLRKGEGLNQLWHAIKNESVYQEESWLYQN